MCLLHTTAEPSTLKNECREYNTLVFVCQQMNRLFLLLTTNNLPTCEKHERSALVSFCSYSLAASVIRTRKKHVWKVLQKSMLDVERHVGVDSWTISCKSFVQNYFEKWDVIVIGAEDPSAPRKG